MRCPYCGFAESRVVDSRPMEDGSKIRRRRECLNCRMRFTTHEEIERLPLMVVKSDGTRQRFDRVKLANSMIKACDKRYVSIEELERVAEEIEQELQNTLEREVTTSIIGELVMQKLKKIDEVAYVRFASVYRQFKDINSLMSFVEELGRMLNETRP